MDWKLHLLAGLLYAIVALGFSVVALKFAPSTIFLMAFLPVTFFYSLLPDIDMKNSVISVFVFMVGLAAIMAAIVVVSFSVEAASKFPYLLPFAGVVAFTLFLVMLAKHTGHFHSIIAGVLLSMPMAYLDIALPVFAFVAYMSHLLCDEHPKKMW